MRSGLAEALARHEASGYDVLHLEQLWSGWLGRGRARALLNVYQLEIVDWERRRLGGWGERKALVQMRAGDDARSCAAPGRSAWSAGDCSARARQINARAEYTVVPFALDVSLYPLQPATAEPVVGLLGSMHWLPSRSAAERLITRIWPRVKRRVPNARLLVGGWNARRYLERLRWARHHAGGELRAPHRLLLPGRGHGLCPGAWHRHEGEGARVDGVRCPRRHHRRGRGGARRARTACTARFARTTRGWPRPSWSQLSDDTSRRAMREAARSLVQARYSREPFLAQMMALYDRVQHGRDRAARRPGGPRDPDAAAFGERVARSAAAQRARSSGLLGPRASPPAAGGIWATTRRRPAPAPRRRRHLSHRDA